MEVKFGFVENNDVATVEAINQTVDNLVAEGFTPNPFACKLPIGKGIKGKVTKKEWRKWEKNGNKGIILSVYANFDTDSGSVADKVTCATLEDWKSFSIGSTITVDVANSETKKEKFAKVIKTEVVLEKQD